MRRTPRHYVSKLLVESLEGRRLMVWGAAPTLIGLDDLAAQRPQLNGAGQTIAIIDTGIDYMHPSLGGGIGPGKKIVGGHDFVDNDETPLDTDGHGTGVAGVIAADQFDDGGFTYRGIAPAAKLVALRIAPDTDAVPLDRIEEALQWVVSHDSTFHFTAVNLSFGFGRFDSEHADAILSDELQELADLDIALVSSAGNGGTDDGFGITYPAADANAFSVGSVNGSDVISEFSQRSSNLDLLAPGENVHSTALGGGFATLAGTSFAAPAVTGTLALMRQCDSGFSIADLKSILHASSPTNFDGDTETGTTTGLTFQRLSVIDSINLALMRRSATPAQAATIGAAGGENDMAFDDQGVLHFVWYDTNVNTMKYATRSAEGDWSTPTLIDNEHLYLGTEFSLKLDSFGRPVLAYLDGPNGDLKVARLKVASWELETIDSKGVTGLYPSLAVDSRDHLFVSYFRKTNRDLKMATFEDGVWSRQTVDADGDVGWSSTITLDADENAAIVYGDAGRNRLKLTRNLADRWNTQVVDGSTLGAAYLSIVFDDSGLPVISYYEVSPADLKVATVAGSGFKIERVATKGATGLYTNLQLDEDGQPDILFWDRRTNSLNRARRNGSKFSVTRISDHAGKYTMATPNRNGGWLYATSTGPKLVLATL